MLATYDGRVVVRVVYLDHVARLSGGELALVRMIDALGTAVEPLVVLAEAGPLVEMLESRGVPTEVLPLSAQARDVRRGQVRPGGAAAVGLVHVALYSWRLSRRLRQLRPDVVHTNSLKSGFYGVLAARLAGVPSVWHVRDRIAADYLPPPAVLLVRFALALLPDGIVCNSRATQATLGLAFRNPRSQVVHDPYTAIIAPAAAPCSHLVVGIVGRLAPWKGQDVFLRAFAVAFPKGEERARVVGSAMFGEDDFAEGLRQLALTLGIQDRVDFVGFTEDVERELAQVDVLVHASISPEPFGQVIVEGLAAGLAVVATAAGGPMEIISDDEDGLLVPAGDVAALALALQRLDASPELRHRLGKAGRERASHFAPTVVGPQMAGFYEDLLSRKRRRSRTSGRPS